MARLPAPPARPPPADERRRDQVDALFHAVANVMAVLVRNVGKSGTMPNRVTPLRGPSVPPTTTPAPDVVALHASEPAARWTRRPGKWYRPAR